ncbi:hypothetical protein [Nocardia concava]|uniref:hypothetical protein n=1 Tax=Nocardia concava TaxID=257281 RepID=UPI0002F837CB|nr:hypothetical protein [Nocardia concava]
MLGTVDEIRRDADDIDPRRLGLVVLVAALMAAGVGAGMWLTGSGDRPIADTSIVNVVRPRHDSPAPARRPPEIAPAVQVPATPNPAPAEANPAPPPPVAPVAPHPVEIPVVIGPDTSGPVDASPDVPAPPDDSAPVPN